MYPIDRGQLQQYCYRKFGPNVACGVYKSHPGALPAINLRVDAFGIRIEGSGWIGAGGDLNVDLLYFGRSNEMALFVTPGGQQGTGGGAAITGGILIGHNMPNSGSYAGASYTLVGGDIPVIPLGINVEGDVTISTQNPDGSIPQTVYIGVGPLQPEISAYSGAGYTISITGLWDSLTGD